MIDKPIGLGGTVYTSESIFVSHLCTMYHQNIRFDNYIIYHLVLTKAMPYNLIQSAMKSTCRYIHKHIQ